MHLHFLGSLQDINRLSVDGKYSFKNAGLELPGSPHKFRNIKGEIKIIHEPLKLDVKGEKLPQWNIRFMNFSGDFGKNEFLGFDGAIRFGSGKPYVSSSGQIKIHAAESSPLLNRLARHQPGLDILQGAEFIDGTLWVKIKGRSRSLDPSSFLTPDQIRFAKVSLKHTKLSRPLQDLEGNFKFTRRGVEIQHAKGRYGNSPINIIVTITIYF